MSELNGDTRVVDMIWQRCPKWELQSRRQPNFQQSGMRDKLDDEFHDEVAQFLAQNESSLLSQPFYRALALEMLDESPVRQHSPAGGELGHTKIRKDWTYLRVW